ncbi:M23 family metallopeptidase [Bartonella sp. DGB1]|uniref:M23 family metallopeptidase n=1 Tax=Bartonella sp. DGB1 TaxID=3239807 RepID=UPI003524D393
MAAGDGVITRIAPLLNGYGNHIVIRHDNGYITSYSHLSKFAKDLKVGMRVKQRQVIGYVGTTGLSTGPHLHYEILVEGRRTDPMRVKLPDDNPLSDEDKNKFIQEKEIIDQILNI